MSAIRYCGALRIRVTYLEPSVPPAQRPLSHNGSYRCVISCVCESYPTERVTIHVGAPAFLSHAVDSSEAFDDAAHAALSFAAHDGYPVDEYAWTKEDGSGYAIVRHPMTNALALDRLVRP